MNTNKKHHFSIIKKGVAFLCLAFLMISCGIKKSLRNMMPDVSAYNSEIPQRQKINDSTYTLANNFLTKNKQGQWELYLSGNPLELGLKAGSLTQELFNQQEQIFINKIDELVPSKKRQKLLRKFLAWFNRKMYLTIDEQYKAEMFGMAKYASKNFDNIAEPYPRVMYFHGAHDIGHALQDLALVGCSTFAAWGNKTTDGKMLIGRNLDFYAGDDFAKNKIVSFVKPKTGFNFMSVSWPGFIGVVSGMNDQGLTVTINAGKSNFPLVAKTPISIVTREILQYASTINEAVAIAKKRKVFVAESIFIGSANDNKAAIIEVSPKKFGVYEVANTNQLICSNHFQSDAYTSDKKNSKHILESHSKYRFDKMEELLGTPKKLSPQMAVDILRNTDGLAGKKIGYGNEKALNQLLAHHGIVFKPQDLMVWVSSNPYQLGEFVAFNLNDIFKKMDEHNTVSLADTQFNIAKDSFLFTDEYASYEKFRGLETEINNAISNKTTLSSTQIEAFEKSNPNFWKTHYLIGYYYYQQENNKLALIAFEKAATKEITTRTDKETVTKYIRKLKRKLH